MKKITMLLLALLMCVGVFSLTACNNTQEKTEKDLIIGLDDAFAPLGFRDENNEIVGFDIDFAVEAVKRMGYNPVLQPIEWSNKLIEIQNDTIDLIWNGFTITEERQREVLFTKPYLANAQVLLVSEDSDVFEISDLEGKIVSSQEDSAGLEALLADEALMSIISGDPIVYSDYVAALNDLEIGRSDAVVIDLVVADYYMKLKPDTFRKLDEELTPEEYGVGVKKGREDLLEELQKAIDSMIEDGTAAAISEKWFDKDIVLR